MRAAQEATAVEMSDAGLQAPSNISLDEIRATVFPTTALVEYFSVQDRILACVLSNNDLQICPVTLQSRVKKLLQLLQFQLSKFRLDPQYVSTFQNSMLEATQAHLKNLYQELIAPVRNLLGAKHLVFVPHGVLHYVPFHALHDGEAYLVDQFSISYAPSASVYALCQRKQVNTPGSALIMRIADAQAPLIRAEVESLSSIL